MGSDLQLTGLASGFDWKPVVEQLVELEGIPKQRLQSEKSANESKVSDLGLLKSQLDALNGAAGALNNDDLYEGRKVGMDSISAAILSASAAAGALTGDFVVSVYSIGTQTEMSSKNRVPGGLGAGLTLSEKLNELPLQSSITTGTFTIAGKTLSIDNLDVTLQSIIDEINAAVSGVSGVNPEEDTTGITFEYDQANDKMIVDGGELSPNSLNAVPVLGSPTDSSNFLHVLRLLNRASVTRDADLEVGSGISVYGTGNNSGTSAWLRLDDGDEANLKSTDPRIFASDGSIIYKRVLHDEAIYDSTLNTHYTTGQKVYRHGFVYGMNAGKNLPDATGNGNGHNWDKTITGVGQDARHDSKQWKLLKDLTTERIGNGTGNAHFTAAVDAGHHGVNLATNATTANNKAIKAGDIVKAQDGEYYRAIQDRTSSTAVLWETYSTDHSSGLAAVAAGVDSAKWANNLPISIYENGRMFAIKAGFTAAEHAGAADSTIYNTANGWGAASKMVVGNRSVATAKVNYYLPKTAAWNNVGTHTGIADVTGYGNGKVVKAGTDFFEAQIDFSAIAAIAANVKYTQGTEVKNAGATSYYEAGSDWASVLDKTTGADPSGRSTTDYVQIGGASGDFFKPKQNFDGTNFPSYDNTQYYQGTGTPLEVKSGSNYFIRTANSKVADVDNGASTTITGAQLTTAIGTPTTFFVNTGTVYTRTATLSGIAAHNAGTAYDVSSGNIYVSGGTNQVYQADSNFKGSFTNSSALAQNEILKDGGGNWYQINDLSSYGNWDGTNQPYNQNDIVQDVANSSRYYKKTSAGTLNAGAGNSAPNADALNWTLATASDLGTDVNANATTLGSGLWSDVTNTFTNLSNTTGWTPATATTADAGWTDINSKVKNPAVGGLDYWSNETATLADPTTGGNWWTDVSTKVGTPATGSNPYWTNKTTDINNLGVVDGAGGDFAETYWEKKDLSAPGAGGGDNTYWEEKGFINSTNSATAGNHDVNYWQRVLPNMKRYDGTATQLTTVDYSIWAKAGSVNAVIGDASYANHDGAEHPTGSAFTFTAWNAGTNYAGGEYVEKGGKVYLATGTSATNNDPATASNNGKWTLVADSVAEARKHVYVDTDYWTQVDIGSDLSTSNYWEKMQETIIQSSQALGTIDMKVSLAGANFGTTLTSSSGIGNFFIGEGEGAVRIDYNVNTDTVSTLVDRVNSSDANVHMYYDPVSDRFVVRNKEAGSVGITLHESTTWDALTANSGTGNLLNAMGLAAPAANYVDYNPANNATYANGTYVSLGGTGGDPTTFWQALQVPTESPSTASTQWRQVIASVGRTMVDELGQNSIVQVNGGDKVYSNKTSFTDAEHGYEGITFDIAQMDVNDSASFVVARDSSQAKAAIDKLVEEFNDAQDYIKSLTSVTNDGERVTSGKFSSNIEISRLGSQLRKVVFGDSTPHSESGTTSDGSNLIINSRATNSAELVAIASDLNFDSNNNGYIVKVLNDAGSGNPKYWTYTAAGGAAAAAEWTQTDPAYSSFRLSSIGLDFGIGSDRIMVKNSALLIQELEKNPDKVKALFSDARVESTKTADAADILATTPKTLTNNDPNSPTGTDAVAGDTIANSAAFDANTSSYRSYQGISNAIDEFISAFLSGDSDSGYKGAYNTHIESIRSQNKRIDERIEDMERYLEQREKTLSDGFMRMEEMQSQLNTQLQTLQNSFKK